MGSIVSVIVTFLVLLAVLIGVGYGLTLLLPLSLFEASFLLLALGVSMVYVILKGGELVKEEDQKQAGEELADEELRWPPTSWIDENIIFAPIGISPEELTWEKFLEYLLARDLWPFIENIPDLTQLPQEERVRMTSQIAGVLVTLLKTNGRVFQTARVTRKEMRPLLMQAALPQGTLAHLGELVEAINVVLEHDVDLVRLIAAHQEWPSLSQRE